MNTARLSGVVLALSLCICYGAEGVPDWVGPVIQDAVSEKMEAFAPYTNADEEERDRIRGILTGNGGGRLDRGDEEMLKRLRFAALPVIEDTLLHSDPQVRRRAIAALLEATFRSEGRFRGNAAEERSKLFNQASVLLLLRSTADPDDRVKVWAVAGLGHAWVADGAVCDSQGAGHLSDDVRALLVATAKKLRHGHHQSVRSAAATALSMMGTAGQDPMLLFASEGFALSATTLDRDIKVREPVPLMVALGWAGYEPLDVNIRECTVHIRSAQGGGRTISVPQVCTFPGVDRKRVETETGRMMLEPVEPIGDPGVVAKVAPDVLEDAEPLPRGMYTVVVSMRVKRYESAFQGTSFTVQRPKADHRLWSRREGQEFELQAPPFELEIW